MQIFFGGFACKKIIISIHIHIKIIKMNYKKYFHSDIASLLTSQERPLNVASGNFDQAYQLITTFM